MEDPGIVENFEEYVEVQDSQIGYKSKAGYKKPVHHHDCVQVLVPMEGAKFCISWFSGDSKIEIQEFGPFDICLIPEMLSHEVLWTNAANFVNFYVPEKFFRPSLSGAEADETSGLRVFMGLRDEFVVHLAKSVRLHFQLAESRSHSWINGLVFVLARHLADNYHASCEGKVLFNCFEQIPNPVIRDAVAFLQSNLDRKVHLDEIAQVLDVSLNHFVRTFKANTGYSPGKFHTMLRVEKAKELLRLAHPIVDVAYELGFASQAHFNTVFSKVSGSIPGQYQRKYT